MALPGRARLTELCLKSPHEMCDDGPIALQPHTVTEVGTLAMLRDHLTKLSLDVNAFADSEESSHARRSLLSDGIAHLLGLNLQDLSICFTGRFDIVSDPPESYDGLVWEAILQRNLPRLRRFAVSGSVEIKPKNLTPFLSSGSLR